MAFSLRDYQITGEIGRGGFASVYRAKQKSLSREVAIKCLSPQRTQNEGEIIRFRREAEAMASLTHDNIVTVYDYAYYNGSYYIVMEYIDGLAFDKAIEKGIPELSSLFVLEKVAGALCCAHAENIIHRDIKPANILLGRNGQVKLADFGLALFQTGIESFSSPVSVLGTISYMAPEALVSPKEVDARIDVFSLGCLLYQLSSGKPPHTGDSFGEISSHLLNDEPQPLSGAGTFGALAPLIMRCLEKDREKRPPMAAIHTALKDALSQKYHAAGETLVSFVRNASAPALANTSQPDAPQVTPSRILPSTGPGLMKQRVALMPLVIGLAVCLTIAALFLFPRLHFPGNPSDKLPLPAMPQMKQSILSDESSGKSPAVLTGDGPAPLDGIAPGINPAHLLLRGLRLDDTVLLNDINQPPDSSLTIAPGHHVLVIRRKTGLAVTRTLELLPHERRVIELSNGGRPHDR